MTTTSTRAPGPPAPVPPSDPARRSLALVVAILFVATVVAVDPSGLVPSGPLRWTVETVLVGVAVAALVARPVRVERLSGRVWLALVGWLFVASVEGADALHAWIGTPDRRLGWLAWCTFPLWYLCGQALTRERDRRTVMRGAAVAAAALGVWCIAERAGRSIINESFAGHRVGGPFGQPAYVGAAAVLLVPLASGVALDRRGTRAWRAVGAFGSVAAFAALLLSQTRGAWIGLLVAVALLAARHAVAARRRWREVALIAAALVVLFAVTPLGGRISHAFDLQHGTTRGRFDDWSVGARVIERHPLVGAGPEGYRVVFPETVSASYVQRYGTAVVPDRAHNGVIDVAAAGGVPAGLLYLALLGFVMAVSWRALRGRDPLTIALACAAVGYIVQQQFLFPLNEIDPLFWLVAGMLIAAGAANTTTRPRRTAVWRAPRRVAGVIAVVIVACAGFAGVMGAREVWSDQLLERAATAPGASDLRDADHATRLRPDSIRAWYVAAVIAGRGPALTDVDAAIARVGRGLRESPRDPALRGLRADLLVERAVRSGLDDDRARAGLVVTQYLSDAPNDPQLWLDRAELAHLDGDAASERAARDRAAFLQPDGKS